MNLILSWAACNGLRIRSADISNAYFQGKPADRLILLKPPRGGIPGQDGHDKYAIAARVPIYGFRDAGRQFWKTFRLSIVSAGLNENRCFKAYYTYQEDGDIKVMLGTHVDDLM